jgi:cytidylate kinase
MRLTTFRFQDFPVHAYAPNTMPHMIIAIDGPAAAGKGTLARKLAQRLGYAYLDTGALYRAVALRVLDKNGKPDTEQDAVAAAKSLSLDLKPEDLQNAALRNDTVGSAASQVAKFPAVRQALLDFQKDFAANPSDPTVGGVILDGRDIGTVICPDAPVKLFVTASTQERSKRRYLELTAKGIETTSEAVLADMIERDKRDSERAEAPLKPAADAHILDTSTMSESEVMERALSIIRGHIVEAAAKG